MSGASYDPAAGTPHGTVHWAEGVSDLEELLERMERPAWHKQALCRGVGPDMWFPHSGESHPTAQAICSHCPVNAQCLETGIHEPAGIWGGLSTRQRTLLNRTRRTA